MFPERIALGDSVFIQGGGLCKTAIVKGKATIRLGKAGVVQIDSLVGQRYGDCFRYDEKAKKLIPTSENPDLDRSEIDKDTEITGDNRDLVDNVDGSNQTLNHDDIIALKESMGVDGLIQNLVERSSTFATKTTFSQEKYIRKKKAKYATLFKVEKVYPDSLAEVQNPTNMVSTEFDDDIVSGKFLKLRVDTVGLILHHGNVSAGCRVMMYERTGGVLPAAVLNRLHEGDSKAEAASSSSAPAEGAPPQYPGTAPGCGMLFTIMDRSMHGNTCYCKNMHIPDGKQRWKTVPWSAKLIFGAGDDAEEDAVAQGDDNKPTPAEGTRRGREIPEGHISQWLRAKDARQEFLAHPVDTLIIAGLDDDVITATLDLLPFLALCGHLVVYSTYLEPLTRLFALIRNDTISIKISETWYRSQQVLPQRTHPQVNMNTAGGYILTAMKVERNEHGGYQWKELATKAAASIAGESPALLPMPVPSNKGGKREREEEVISPTSPTSE